MKNYREAVRKGSVPVDGEKGKAPTVDERHESVTERLEAELAHKAREALSEIRKKGGQPGNTNAVKHALTGRFFLVEGEDPAEFEALRQSYFEMLGPKNVAEAQMVLTIVEETWRCQRARAIDCALMEKVFKGVQRDETGELVEARLANLSRYQRSLTVSLDKAIRRLKVVRELSERSERVERAELSERAEPVEERRPMTAQEILDESWEPSGWAGSLDQSDGSDESDPSEIPPSGVPLEEVIQAFERKNVPFAMSDLVAQGYRFHDPEWEGYRSPMDTDEAIGVRQ